MEQIVRRSPSAPDILKIGVVLWAIWSWISGHIQIVSPVSELMDLVGFPFLIIYCLIVLGIIFQLFGQQRAISIERYDSAQQSTHTGIQLTNLLATVSLVFTLWGLSQGILLLSEGEVNPENIDELLGQLMTHFGTAFYSSIVGLPTAAVARFIFLIHVPKIKS